MMASGNSMAFVMGGIICLLAISNFLKRSSKRLYPPGPKAYPLLGNIRDIPRPDEAFKYSQYSKTYNGIYHLSALGAHIVVISCPRIAEDLLVKRASNYSDRPSMPLLTELGWDFAFAMMPMDDTWKRHRKLFDAQFRPANMHSCHSTIQAYTLRFLEDLLKSPNSFSHHIHQLVASISIHIMYGSAAEKHIERLQNISEQAIAILRYAPPGAFLVDRIPLLKYLPSWFPGARFKRKAYQWRQITREMVESPFNLVCDAIVNNTASPCFVADAIHQLKTSGTKLNSTEMDTIRNCAGIGYPGESSGTPREKINLIYQPVLAAGDTSGSAILSLFLAMALHPDVQQRAQEELDSVCQTRMPEFSDRQSLPYINALCAEVLRWSSPVPLAFPHTTVEDDTYNGFFIPARSIVMVDSFSMNFNEETYPQPHKFDPERFLSADRKTCVVSSASSAAFSFGKRKCPGRYLADAELFFITASVLKCFTIKPEPGVVLPVRHEELFTSEIVSSPLPFKCVVQPRGEQCDDLIKDALAILTPPN